MFGFFRKNRKKETTPDEKNRETVSASKPAPAADGQKGASGDSKPGNSNMNKSINDKDVWQTRSLDQSILLKAAELKPEYEYLGEKMFFRIDYLLSRRLSFGSIIKACRELAEYPGAMGIQVFTGNLYSDSLTQIGSLDELDPAKETASVAVAGQFRLGMAPMFVQLFNQTSIIRVRIHKGMNLPVDQGKVDMFLEEVLEKAFQA